MKSLGNDELRRLREAEDANLKEELEKPYKVPSQESWHDESNDSKKKSSISSKIETENRNSLESTLKIHAKIIERLSVASKALVEASNLSEGLRNDLSRNDFFRKINLDRRIRLSEIIRTVNVARQNVTRVFTGSQAVNKYTTNSIDELVHLDSRTTFE